MALTKVYNRINWENEPSLRSPLNETNLNTIDYGINEIDNRVISLDTTKMDKADSYNLIKDISFDATNGKITFTRVNNTEYTIDTNLEKLAVNFDYDYQYQQLIITLDDGSEKTVDLTSLISEYDFLDSSTIQALFTGTDYQKQVYFEVKDGTITANKLQPNYLADIQTETTNSLNYAKLSKSWAQGNTNARTDENTNNAKYWSEIAQNYAGIASGSAINYRGDYNPEISYVTLDAVYYDGSTWVAKVDNPSVTPQEGYYWRYLAKGSKQPWEFVTQSQYDNLPVGKLTDDIMYFIES